MQTVCRQDTTATSGAGAQGCRAGAATPAVGARPGCGCGLGPSGPAQPLGLRPAGLARAYPGSSWWPGALPPVGGGGHAAAPRATWWSRCAWCGPGVRSARPRLCSVPSHRAGPHKTRRFAECGRTRTHQNICFVQSGGRPGGGRPSPAAARWAARGRAAGPCSVCLGAYAVAHSAPASRICVAVTARWAAALAGDWTEIH